MRPFPNGPLVPGIRGLALGEAASHHHSPDRQNLLHALARLGNNLNQIARGINRANLTGDEIDAVRVLAKLVEIQETLDRLL